MAKRKVLSFDSEEAFDFILIGVVCHQRGYKLCHSLNQTLAVELSREEKDYELKVVRRVKPLHFPMYSFESEDNDQYFLIGNKAMGESSKAQLLIPEQPQVNFFLMIKENFPKLNMESIINEIRSIPIVLGAYPIDIKSLKSREHLLF